MLGESNIQEQPASAAQQAPEAGSPTVITIGLTLPVIGGGLVLAYLGGRRMAAGGAKSNGAQNGSSGAAGFLGTAAETATGAVRDAGEAAGRTAGTARERVIGATRLVRTSAGATAAGAADRARGLQDAVAQNPALALGIGLSIGALAGLVVPTTRQERDVLKPASETVVKQVQAGAQQTAEKVRLVAEDAGTSIRESANQVGLIPVAVGSDGGQG